MFTVWFGYVGGVAVTGRKKELSGRELVMPAERLFNKKPTAEFEPMDVFGKEPAPEPNVVMDSDKDFKPGESEVRRYHGTTRLPDIFRRHKPIW